MVKFIKRIGCLFGVHDFWNVYFHHSGTYGNQEGTNHNFVTCMKCNRMFWNGGFVEGKVQTRKK